MLAAVYEKTEEANRHRRDTRWEGSWGYRREIPRMRLADEKGRRYGLERQ